MTIKRLEFTDRFRDWHLTPTEFSDFNLLVGKSGAGKTRILSAFRTVREAGTRNVRGINGCEWEIELSISGETYCWNMETSVVEGGYDLGNGKDDDQLGGQKPLIKRELIRLAGTETPLIDRTEERFLFNGNPLPKLANDTSAITLLREEEMIAPLYVVLKRIQFSRTSEGSTVDHNFRDDIQQINREFQESSRSLQSLREASSLGFDIRVWLLQQNYPERFERLKRDYSSIFPGVTDIMIRKRQAFEPNSSNSDSNDILTIAIKEEGVKDWIVADRLSSGMYKTLIHLIELELTPAGTVIIIDELENGLGVNCLDATVDILLRRSTELQFIVTSHHPYVINNVPLDRWRVVTRKGSVITVKDKNEIPALQGKSAQDNFIRLINAVEYEEGIQ